MVLNKLLSVVVISLGVTASMTALATPLIKTKTSTAIWDVTAVKDSSAGLVVSPTNSMKFVYDPVTNSWAAQKANFNISVLGNSDTGTVVNDFKIEAKLGSIASVSNPIDDSTLGLEVSVGDTQLSKTPIDVTSLLPNVADFTGGANGEDESAASWLNVKIAKPEFGEFKDATDGVYIGELSVDFIATWELDVKDPR